MSKTKLREGGIYSLTDKREFVVCKSLTTGVGYLLYNAEDRRLTGAADYRVHEDGRLSSQGRITRWRVEHLSDTGRTIDHFNNLSAATTAGDISNQQKRSKPVRCIGEERSMRVGEANVRHKRRHTEAEKV